MQIEEKTLASLVVTGCEPVDAIIELAGNFVNKIGGLIIDLGQGLLNWVQEAIGFVGNAIEWFGGLLDKFKSAVAIVGQKVSGTIP